MCTLSWVPRNGGYALAMNRDERRTRAPARPPVLEQLGGVPVLLPRDGDAGGTWIALNAWGHTLALLNRWDESPHDPPDGWVSRGLLVTRLAPLAGPDDVERALSGIALASYRPFTLASTAPGRSPRLFEWDGRELGQSETSAPGMVRTSSGADQEGAERVRGGLFREAGRQPGGLTSEVLLALHRSHLPEKGPLSICMHRQEAVTVSCSLITVSPRHLSFRYIDGSPCESQVIATAEIKPALRAGPDAFGG